MDVVIRMLTPLDDALLEHVYTHVILQGFLQYPERLRNYFATGDYKNYMLTRPIRVGAFVDNDLVGFLLAEHPVRSALFVTWMGILHEYNQEEIARPLVAFIENFAKKHGVNRVQLQADHKHL